MMPMVSGAGTRHFVEDDSGRVAINRHRPRNCRSRSRYTENPRRSALCRRFLRCRWA
jgi:hypothetical protein